MGVELIHFIETRHKLTGIAERLATPGVRAMAPEFEVLQAEEEAIFAHWGGRFVDTGRAKASLTSDAGGDSIREIHGVELVFGTNVDYVRYLTTDMSGGHPKGRNAVEITPYGVEAAGAGQRILRRILHGDIGGLA